MPARRPQPPDLAAPPPRRRLRAAARRESILDAATEVFAGAGYRAGRVGDIAARVGVSEPVIYQNFGSKAALYGAVLGRVADEMRSELRVHAEHHGAARDLLAHALDPSHAGHARGSVGVLFADAATLIGDPELGEAAKHAVGVVAGHLADLLGAGQARGELRDDLDLEAAAWLLVSVLSARPLRAAAVRKPASLERRVTALLREVLAPASDPPTAPSASPT